MLSECLPYREIFRIGFCQSYVDWCEGPGWVSAGSIYKYGDDMIDIRIEDGAVLWAACY
jgi:hypothetical protein